MKNILVISPYSLQHGIASGGQQRLYQLCRGLSKNNAVVLLDIYHPHSKKNLQDLEFQERTITLNRTILALQTLNSKVTKLKNVLFPFIALSSLFNKEFKRALKQYSAWADVIVIEQPYLIFNIKKLRRNQLLIYDAQNVEYLYYKALSKKPLYRLIIAQFVRFLEHRTVKRCDYMFSVSHIDKILFHKLYKTPLSNIIIVPNGVVVKSMSSSAAERQSTEKAKCTAKDKKVLLFVGSNHSPNVEAAEFILFRLSQSLKDYLFFIVGNVTEGLKNKYKKTSVFSLPNIRYFNLIDEDRKMDIFRCCDIALNPIFSGSGTNFKVLEYMAAGIPVVTTPFGARGLAIQDNNHAIISHEDDFVSNIRALLKNKALCERLIVNARKLVEDTYDWEVLMRKAEDAINARCHAS
ncbi:glycosyltransferase family 4 protein [Candidatus Omnitrophota bacterium]